MRRIALVLLFCIVTPLLAQDEAPRLSPEERSELQLLRPRIGLFAGAGLNLHSGDFAGLPEAPSCMITDESAFGGDMGIGFGGGLLFELPLTPKFFLQARAGYQMVGATLTDQANIGPVRVGDDTASAISEYTLDASLGMLAGGIDLGWRPFAFPLTFRLGPDVGMFMQKGFEQREELLEPSSASFEAPDGSSTRIRNPFTGDVANTALQIFGTLGVDYELPMNADRTLLLVPEIRYSFPFTKVRSDLDWRIHVLRGGIALKYSFPIPKPAPPMMPPGEPSAPPPPPPAPVLAATIMPYGVSREGIESDVLKITVEEFINTQTHALLNYIFFDENSATIPPRYRQSGPDVRQSFSIDQLYNKGTMDVYHQILDIVGRRMIEDPGAKITLTGTNTNEGAEKGNKALSQARAESVKNYLVNTWGIDPGRVGVQSRNLPSLPSNVDSADGDEENRRVEITSNRASLLEPVTTNDTLRTVDPPTLRLKVDYTADAGIDAWSLRLRQGDRALKEFSGEGEIPEELDWNIEKSREEIPLTQSPVVATLTLRDLDGGIGTARAALPVEQITIRKKREERLGDLVFDRFNLITFEFNSANLSAPSRKIAAEIREVIKPESEVEIVGYSDRLGEEAHNFKLSQERAVNTAKELRVPVTVARGGGENTTLYDNELPEGRFYSRTVDILVKTPVE